MKFNIKVHEIYFNEMETNLFLHLVRVDNNQTITIVYTGKDNEISGSTITINLHTRLEYPDPSMCENST